MLLKSLQLLTLFLAGCFNASNSSDILFLAPFGSKSHKNFYNGIIYALADKGHKVTVYNSFPSPKKHPNIEDVLVKDFAFDKVMPNVFKDQGVKPIFRLIESAPETCSKTLGSVEAQGLFKRKFDLVIISMFFSDCYIPSVYKLGIPYVAVMPAALFSPLSKMMGNPNFPSINPEIVFGLSSPLNFFGRFQSALGSVFMTEVVWRFIEYRIESVCQRAGLCPDDVPSVREIERNFSAIITNSIRTNDAVVQAYMPNIIHAGGIHLKPAVPLPNDLEKWVNDSGDAGFIFFSLGSAAKPSDMPEHYRQILCKVFGSLKQKVLWKWDEDTMEGLPKNVRLGKWLPQQDLLGHPKLQLFITHGGLHSTQESVYHGVKVIGMPLFADQKTNIKDVANQGLAKVLEWNDLTFDKLKNLIREVIENKDMKIKSKQRSVLIQDQIRPPQEEVVYWMEYIIRHKGAPHLRSPLLDLYWYEIYNVDVWACVVVMLLALCSAIILSVRGCFRFCCKKKTNKKFKKA